MFSKTASSPAEEREFSSAPTQGSDLDFVSRLLAEEGIGCRFEGAADGLPGATVVFFADATAADNCSEDVASASTAGGAGIRFHRDGVQEEQDTIQVFGGVRSKGRQAEEDPEAHGFRSAALAVQRPRAGTRSGPM